MGFFAGMAGAFLTAVLGGLVALPTDTKALAVYVGLTITTGVLSLWFAMQWRTARTERQKIATQVRARSSTSVALQFPSTSVAQPNGGALPPTPTTLKT